MVITSWSLDRRWQRIRRPLAVLLIGVGALLLWSREHAPITTLPTVVATADVAVGDVVGPDDVEVVAWPAESRPPPAAADPATITGRRAASAIRAGEPLTDQRVIGPSLLATAGADSVAVSLPADPLSASGLVRPGDRVDVIGGRGAVLVSGAPVLTVSQETGTVLAVPASVAPNVVSAAGADAIALVLAQA